MTAVVVHSYTNIFRKWALEFLFSHDLEIVSMPWERRVQTAALLVQSGSICGAQSKRGVGAGLVAAAGIGGRWRARPPLGSLPNYRTPGSVTAMIPCGSNLHTDRVGGGDRMSRPFVPAARMVTR